MQGLGPGWLLGRTLQCSAVLATASMNRRCMSEVGLETAWPQPTFQPQVWSELAGRLHCCLDAVHLHTSACTLIAYPAQLKQDTVGFDPLGTPSCAERQCCRFWGQQVRELPRPQSAAA